MAAQQPVSSTPSVSFETSPVESLMSAPDDLYPSLFDTADDDTINPAESVMTPQSPGDCPTPGASGDSSDKKTKKRKSWGQVLPEPKTNLPPRKRAKTEDEKEQRRVERVLRNRRAAQSSRERKRQEVEALEHRCRQLEAALRSRDNTVTMLMEKLRRSEGGSRSPSPFDSLQPSPLTLSQPLFGSSSKDTPVEGDAGMMDDFVLMPESNNGTVNPASLSPELSPVPESKSTATAPAPAAPATASTSTDTTQHPAAVLCDLQCPSVKVPQQWVATRQAPRPALSLFLQLQALLTASSVMFSACRHPLTLIAGALKTNLALQPTPSILSTIIWLVTLPPTTRSSTSNNSSATTSAAPPQARQPATTRSPKTTRTLSSASSTLRIKSLKKLLTSSPILARPLRDATMELLRLVSEGCDDRCARSCHWVSSTS
jgi:transcriptional activator HAC1